MKKISLREEYSTREAEEIQWLGVFCILVMYIISSFFPHLHPFNLVFGLLGSAFFSFWAYLVENKAQMVVNLVAFLICLNGLIW